MDALTEYLQGAYGEQRAAIEDLRDLARAGMRTLVAHAGPGGTWPRDLAAEAIRDPTVATTLAGAFSPSAAVVR